jgi:hypothetical protein
VAAGLVFGPSGEDLFVGDGWDARGTVHQTKDGSDAAERH